MNTKQTSEVTKNTTEPKKAMSNKRIAKFVLLSIAGLLIGYFVLGNLLLGGNVSAKVSDRRANNIKIVELQKERTSLIIGIAEDKESSEKEEEIIKKHEGKRDGYNASYFARGERIKEIDIATAALQNEFVKDSAPLEISDKIKAEHLEEAKFKSPTATPTEGLSKE